ncbi:DUF2059 domain-containing protein [Phenylobacterium sp.]|uniref:DUF2059 domain-containing protein n=1 Tax=Phenylobacterium sp. TaxID=1871053 RepID=UPI002810CEE2|nr:DUF2059 domain-containing protein [Phenylobacterium sp.]
MTARLFAAGLAALVLAAAPAQAAPSARQMDLAKRYIAAANLENMVGALTAQLTVGMVDALSEQAKEPITAELRIAVGDAAEETARAMTPKFVERMLPVIADAFTEAELAAAVAYMESPDGRSFMQKSPALMGKVDAAVRPLQEDFAAEMEVRLCQKIGCEPKRR